VIPWRFAQSDAEFACARPISATIRIRPGADRYCVAAARSARHWTEFSPPSAPGRGQVIMLRGEPGIGMAALIDYAVEETPDFPNRRLISS